MGFVVEPEEARNTPCGCFELEDEELLCHSDGIMGFLSDEQEGKYCTHLRVKETPGGLEEQVTKFRELGDITDKCFEGEVEDTWKCVSKEAEKKADEKSKGCR